MMEESSFIYLFLIQTLDLKGVTVCVDPRRQEVTVPGTTEVRKLHRAQGKPVVQDTWGCGDR